MSWVDKFFGEKDKDKVKTHSDVPRATSQRSKQSASDISKQEQEYYEGKKSIEEIDYMFRQMDQLPDLTPLDDELWPKGGEDPMKKTQEKAGTVASAGVKQNASTGTKTEVQQNDTTLPNTPEQPINVITPNGVVQPNKGVNQPKGAKYVYTPKYYEENIKLTIILIENTADVAKQKDTLKQIIKSLVVSGLVCVINYGKVVREGKIIDAKDFDCDALLYEEFARNNACLYDALNALENVVKKNYNDIIDETKFKRKKIKSIEIIGIGRCVDNCSISSSQHAIQSFSQVIKNRDITSKYFCLSEESFIQAATIGFHSIGSISRNYM